MKQLTSHLYPSLWYIKKGFPSNSVSKEYACNSGDLEAWVLSLIGKLPWRRERLPTPVFFGFPCGSAGKEYSYSIGDLETWVWSLGWEAPLEKGKATYSSILAWRIPWTALSMGLQRVGHNWATFTTLYGRYQSIWFILFMILSIFIFLKLAECIFFSPFLFSLSLWAYILLFLYCQKVGQCVDKCAQYILFVQGYNLPSLIQHLFFFLFSFFDFPFVVVVVLFG